MESDDIWRIFFLVGLALGASSYLIGGFAVSVAGTWRDGAQAIVLRQLGPLVWGEATLPGGSQTYRGRVVFGRLRVMRSDHGEAHLRGLGFDETTWRQVNGRVTGHLRLRRRGEQLVGTFTGRRFAVEGGRIRNVFAVAPVPRTWERAGPARADA